MTEPKCPNCGKYFDDPEDYYEEPEMFNGFWRTWHFYCSNCGKKYAYTRTYICILDEIKEE